MTAFLGVFFLLGMAAVPFQSSPGSAGMPVSSEAGAGDAGCKTCGDGDHGPAVVGACLPVCPALAGVIAPLGLPETPLPPSAFPRAKQRLLAGWPSIPDPHPPKTTVLE